LQSGTGVAAVVDGEFNCTTGGGLGAYATIATNRTLPYRPGEGGECKLTARFDAGVTGTAQLAGLLSLTDSLSFAMFGSIFGILRLHHGELETQELQITTAATGAGNVTVTVDGTAYVVPVTNDTAQVNAKEITTSLTAQVANYLFSADDDTVLAIATVAIEATLPFGFSAGAVPSIAAVWTPINTGSEFDTEFLQQSLWNGGLTWTVDPTKGNVYKIEYQYLGYGNIYYSVENPETGRFELAHMIKYPNTNTQPSLGSPAMRAGWSAVDQGAGGNISLCGPS
ncbi:unnamed protein product, partial [marine sediment metagenome]